MYKAGEMILYGAYGVCRIEEIAEKEFMGESKEYYVLKPLHHSTGTLFASVNSEKAGHRMRPILTEAEIYELLQVASEETVLWVEKESERKEIYRRIISEGNRRDLIRMWKGLNAHKQKREAAGKRLYLSDERFFNEAERILYEEFQYVLGVRKDEFVALISGQN